MEYICIGLGDDATAAAAYKAMFEAQATALGLPHVIRTGPCQ